jgi:hypothetical protein
LAVAIGENKKRMLKKVFHEMVIDETEIIGIHFLDVKVIVSIIRNPTQDSRLISKGLLQFERRDLELIFNNIVINEITDAYWIEY